VTEVCECGKPTDDHTIRELRVCHPAERLNLPYEECDMSGNLADQGQLAGGLVVRGLVVDLPESFGGTLCLPALGFTFFGPDGLTEVAKTLLVLDDNRMRNLRNIVGSAIDGALKHARRRR